MIRLQPTKDYRDINGRIFGDSLPYIARYKRGVFERERKRQWQAQQQRWESAYGRG